MDSTGGNRFADLFKENKYLTLKNHLYNYLLRKRAIKKCLQQEKLELILEIGSGISPVVTNFNATIYSDLSFEAVKILSQTQGCGYYVVADGMQLPFKSHRFSHIVCSEVLEHLANDLQAMKEMSRILKPSSGCLIITVPHRKCYFSNDDYFVKHYRRYEILEIKNRLKASALQPVLIQKVLGPLEKITMSLAVYIFTLVQRRKPGQNSAQKGRNMRLTAILANLFEWTNLFYKGYVWLDAMIMPRTLATVILIKSFPSKKEC
jgi:ubiquinone/menaquinone biosynthesis C-methylase UbiE